MERRRWVVGCALVGLLLLGGCGGDDSSGGAATETTVRDTGSDDRADDTSSTDRAAPDTAADAEEDDALDYSGSGGGGAADPVSTGNAPDACALIPFDELAEIVGYQLYEGEPVEMPPGESQCDFERPPGFYVSTTYANTAVPEEAFFSSVVITTNPTTEGSFAEFREMLGDQAEDVPGIGDGAYFWGPNLLYVRVGDVGFSVRVYASPNNDAETQQMKDITMAIAQRGVEKLR